MMIIKSRFPFKVPRLPGAGRVVNTTLRLLRGTEIETTIDGSDPINSTLLEVVLEKGDIVSTVEIPDGAIENVDSI